MPQAFPLGGDPKNMLFHAACYPSRFCAGRVLHAFAYDPGLSKLPQEPLAMLPQGRPKSMGIGDQQLNLSKLRGTVNCVHY